MAWVQTVSASSGLASSLTPSITVTAGNSLIVEWRVGGGADATVSASVDGTFGSAEASGNDGGGVNVGHHILRNVTAGTQTITVTRSGSGAMDCLVHEYTPLGVRDAVSVVNTGFSGTASSASITPTNGGGQALAFVINTAGATHSAWGSGFTERSDFAGVANLALADLVPSGTSAISASATLSASGFWSAWAVSYKSAARKIILART